MTPATKLIDDERAYAREIALYVERLRHSLENDENAVEAARQALIETGVINPDGSSKETIVSWE